MTHYGVVGAMTAADLDLPALCAADHVHISGFYNFKGETALSSKRNIWTRVECLDHQTWWLPSRSRGRLRRRNQS